MWIQNVRVIRPLKAWAEAVDEWMRDMTDIGSHEHHATIIGQAIARGLLYQKTWYFNCVKYGHLKQNWEQGISKCNGLSKYNSEGPYFQKGADYVARVTIGPMNIGLREITKAISCHRETIWGEGLPWDCAAKMFEQFPSCQSRNIKQVEKTK